MVVGKADGGLFGIRCAAKAGAGNVKSGLSAALLLPRQ